MSLKSHFDDCPYFCNENGKILDRKLRKMIECPHCSKLKKELLAKGVVVEESTDKEVLLADILGISSKYLSRKYIFESVIPEGERAFLEPESIEYVKSETEDLYHLLSVGEVPENSYCFGLSIKGRTDRVAFPMLATAYLNGLKVAKVVTCCELARLQLRSDDVMDDLLNADILFIVIGEGSMKSELYCAKGMMQARAYKGKPTVFLTTWSIEACSMLLGYVSDPSLHLAKPVFVRYKNSKKQSNYINQLTGVENSQYSGNGANGGTSFSEL